MRKGWTFVVLAACAAGIVLTRPAIAQEPGAPVPTSSADPLADAIAAITGEYASAEQAFYAKIKGLEDEAAVGRMYDESYPKVAAYVSRVQSALAGHESEPAAAAGFAWIAQNADDDAARQSAREALLAHHLASPEMAEVIRSLAWGWAPGDEAFLERVSREGPHEIQGQALFSLAQRKTRESMADPPEQSERATQAEQLLGRVRDEYGDVKSGKSTLAPRVEPYLYELQHLRIGMTAPEIEGTGVDGATFKLSDYRGKVVILDFWGFW